MRKHEMLDQITVIADRLRVLSRSKGEEYSNSSEDALANFKRLSEQLGLTPDSIIWVYLEKHLDALRFAVRNNGSVLSESIESRIDDAILYLVLLRCVNVERRWGKPTNGS